MGKLCKLHVKERTDEELKDRLLSGKQAFRENVIKEIARRNAQIRGLKISVLKSSSKGKVSSD